MKFHRLALLSAAVLSVSHLPNFAVAEDKIDEPIDTGISDEPPAPYTPPEGAEDFAFEAEVSRMLDIVVNSLYQNKDVFLRELISNASDALDKIRFLGIEKPDWLNVKPELEVKIEYDEENNTLTVTDSGLGMTHDDLVKNLGTVARSGTTKFVEAMKEGQNDLNMIGKFGVGFYSSFLVADRVRVASKHPDEESQNVWESSNGESSFHIYQDPRGDTLGRGTEITLFMKPDAREYLSASRLRDLATHYSEFVTHPISLRTTETKMVPVEEEPDDEEPPSEEELEVGEEEDAEEMEPEMEEITTYSWERLNTNVPIWTRSKEDIEDEEYQQFYKAISKDYSDATAWTHFDAEGNINFKSLLYLPSELPEYLRYNLGPPEDNGLNLYVRKVLISDTFELLPRYLGFMKGVVDSDDLPLNVNRENVQESKIIKIIQKKLVRKAIEMIRKLSQVVEEEEEKEVELDEEGNIIEDNELDVEEPKEHVYISWYKKFGTSLKMGCLDDEPNRPKLLKLLRFKTSTHHKESDFVSLQEYVDRMAEWQTDIYYFAGDKIEDAEANHFMDKFKSKGVEVLYLTDPVDEYMFSNIQGFGDHKFMSITKEDIKFKDGDEDLEKRREKAYKKKFEPLTKLLKKMFGSSVTKVVVSSRLEKAPAMISSTKYSHSANMERIMRAQAFQHGAEDDVRNRAMRVFEINPRHPFISSLLDLAPPVDDEDFKVDDSTKDAIWLLHDVALLNSGFTIQNTKNFSKRMTRVLKNQLSIDSLALEDEIEPPEEDDEPDDFEDDDTVSMNMNDFDMSQFNMDIDDLDM